MPPERDSEATIRNLIPILWSAIAYLGGPEGAAPLPAEGDPAQSKSAASSPGMRLTYEEKSRDASTGLEMVTYILKAGGFPADKRFTLVGQRMDGKSVEIAKGIRIDESGRVLGPDGEEVKLSLGRMFAGEFAVFALTSEDGSAKASVEITPFPIQAEGAGGCRLSVQPMSLNGQIFEIRGVGFKPDAKLKTTSTSSGERGDTEYNSKNDGTLKVILFPATRGRSGGDASFTASDSTCSATVNYKWGDQMRGAAASPARGRKSAAVAERERWDTLYREGSALYREGKFAEALPVLQQALRLAESSFGAEDPTVAASLHAVASIYHSQGKYAEAEPLYKRALEISEKYAGPKDSQVSQMLSSLAALYQAQGKLAEAEPLYKRSLAIAEKADGPDKENLAAILTSYARLLRETRRPEEADQMEARARKIRSEPATPAGSAGARPPETPASDRFEEARDAYHRGDYAAALKVFRELAAQGNVDAQAALGQMYMAGAGVPQDPKQGFDWYRKAADQGFAPAELNVGVSYEKGLGVKKDLAEAARWYRKAAERGLPAAQKFLGDMYAKGMGVPKDRKEAEEWYRKAAAAGEPEAAALVDTSGALQQELARQSTAKTILKIALQAVDLDERIGLVKFLMTHPMTLTLGTEKVTQENAKDVLARLERERRSLDDSMERMGTTGAGGDYTLGEPATNKCKILGDRRLEYPVKVNVARTKQSVELRGEGIAGCGYVLGNLLVVKDVTCSGTSPSRLLGVVTDTGIEDLTLIYDGTGDTSCKLGSLTRQTGPG